LFTDVVDSTAWRVRVGDAAADARMAELERMSRDVVAAHGGSVVKGLGDGVMARSPLPSRRWTWRRTCRAPNVDWPGLVSHGCD